MGQNNLDDISVSSQFFFQVFRSCQDLGARKPILLSALDITDSKLRDPEACFDRQSVTKLYEATVHELGRSNLFQDIGFGMIPVGFSDIGYAALFGDTVEDVFRAAATAIDFGASRPMLRWERTGSICRLICDPASESAKDLVLLVFSMLFHIGKQATNGVLMPIKAAHFQYREPKSYDEFNRSANHPLNVPCYFNQSQTYFELHRDVMMTSNPLRNKLVADALKERTNGFYADDRQALPLTNLSYEYLFYLLDKSGLSLDAAAETFGMAERTMRRKLVAEGASFRQILEQVRRDACQLYFLEGTRSLSEIATKLGYSELSAFTRAYTSWHGRSPSRDLAAHNALAA